MDYGPSARSLANSSPHLAVAIAARLRPRGVGYVIATLLASLLAPVLAGLVLAIVVFAVVVLATGSTVASAQALLALASGEGIAQYPGSVISMVALVLSFSPLFLFVWLWLRVFERRPFHTVGFRGPGLARYARGWLIGLALFVAPIVILAILGMLRTDDSTIGALGAAAIPGVTLMLLGWAVQGAGEEVLTRGLMLQTVALRFGAIAGIVVSSVLFATLHALNANLTALALVNLFLFGAFACFFALREGGLWGVCSIHSAWNWAQGQVFGLPVSGGSRSADSLLALRPDGPDIITGGAFGPEGGLAVTAVLLIGCAVVLYSARSRPARAD